MCPEELEEPEERWKRTRRGDGFTGGSVEDMSVISARPPRPKKGWSGSAIQKIHTRDAKIQTIVRLEELQILCSGVFSDGGKGVTEGDRSVKTRRVGVRAGPSGGKTWCGRCPPAARPSTGCRRLARSPASRTADRTSRAADPVRRNSWRPHPCRRRGPRRDAGRWPGPVC